MMLSLIVFTANILGSLNDPFEFAGDYGKEINPIRESVFEQLVTREAIASNLTDAQIQEFLPAGSSLDNICEYRQQVISEAIQQDHVHGPTLKELVSQDLINLLIKKQQELHLFPQEVLNDLLDFIDRYANQRVFSFLRHNPPILLKIDKLLPDLAAQEGKDFDLPILGSTQPLEGSNAFELKAKLLDAVFKTKTIENVKPLSTTFLETLDPHFLADYLGENARNEDLIIFTTPVGQTFFYWLYQSLNLHLVAQNEEMIQQINKVKRVFAETLGNPKMRAEIFRDQIFNANASLLFTQECDHFVAYTLTENGLFHSIQSQNSQDGTLVFLRSDIWEPEYQVIGVNDYKEYDKGRLNLILATTRETKEKFLLASSHGNSTKAEDGRLQISKIVEKFHELVKLPENKDLQLIIGVDANTKSERDVALLQHQLDALGLVSTHVGPTTIKKRMVTAQHSKAGRFAIDEEDYIITLKPENGGHFQLVEQGVGFQCANTNDTIPNLDNLSDHYPVKAVLNESKVSHHH